MWVGRVGRDVGGWSEVGCGRVGCERRRSWNAEERRDGVSLGNKRGGGGGIAV